MRLSMNDEGIRGQMHRFGGLSKKPQAASKRFQSSAMQAEETGLTYRRAHVDCRPQHGG